MFGPRALVLTAAGATLVLSWPRAALAQPPEDKVVAETLVKQLDQDAAHHTVIADALKQARDAIEKATRMRAGGDEGHAKAADGLAREWAETARDLALAAAAESSAADLRQKALDARARLERDRALVEEGIARVGRLTTELSHAEKPEKRERVAVEVHEGKDDTQTPAKKVARGEEKKKPTKAAATGGTP
jgi:hypothetical protein